MPRFALLDAGGVVINVVALGRKEDFTEVLHHVRDDAGEITQHEDGAAVLKAVPTDDHLTSSGASDLVEITADTGPAVIGMRFPPPKVDPSTIVPPTLLPAPPARLAAPAPTATAATA